MRVAYVCADPGVPVFGEKGCSVHVQEVIRAFLERGDHVQVFCTRRGDAPPGDLATVPAWECAPSGATTTAMRERAQQVSATALAERVARHGDFDLVYERHSLWSHAAAEWAQSHDVPVVVEVNAPLIREQATFRELVDCGAAEYSARRCFTAASLVAAVSPTVADYVRHFGGLACAVTVVPNGVSLSRFRPRGETAVPGVPVTIGFVGALRPWHAVLDLVAAFARLVETMGPVVRLRIIGDGPLRAELDELVGNLVPTTQRLVEQVGHVAPTRVPDLLAACDVACAPYAAGNDFYYSPLKLYEYLAAGLPVVAADVGELSQVIVSGHTGLLYQPGNVRHLAEQLGVLCQHAELRRQLGRQARIAAEQQHSWQCRLDSMLRLLPRHTDSRASVAT